jgi:Nucleoside 2-deoxyribosyltransferase
LRFYLAARFSRQEELQGYAEVIRAEGDEVTSRWHDGHQDHTLPRPWVKYAQEDIDDLRRADVVIVFAGGSTKGGVHFECGLAYGIGKRILLVGEPENVFHDLLEQFDDFVAAYHRTLLERALYATTGLALVN